MLKSFLSSYLAFPDVKKIDIIFINLFLFLTIFGMLVVATATIEFSDSKHDSHHVFRDNNYQNVKTPYSSELTLDYTLDSFAIGPSNEFAFSAISNAVNGDISFNPLLIYSDVGLGKTHLLLSARKKMISDGLNCLYITSEQFMRNFVNSVRNNDVESFRNRYEVLDSLLIDDVQFLSGKDQTQDIIYHIFNSMYQRGKQIILTSNCHPNELIAFNSNLKSLLFFHKFFKR